MPETQLAAAFLALIELVLSHPDDTRLAVALRIVRERMGIDEALHV